MSYSLIYDKQFIKISETKVIPMFLQGCSNLFENDYRRPNSCGKRVRDWENEHFLTKGELMITETELFKRIDDYRNQLIEENKGDGSKYVGDSKYNDNEFGWFTALSINNNATSKTTFAMYKNLYKTGIKQAMTVEELIKNNVTVHLKSSQYSDNKDLLPEVSFVPKSSQELEDKINEIAPIYKETGINLYITYLSYGMERLRENQKRERKYNKYNTPLKPKKELTSYYVVGFEEGFLSKLTGNGFKYSYNKYLGSTKKIKTEKQAQSYVDKLSKRFSKYTFNFEKIEKKVA